MFSIDGVQYNVKCTIDREWEIKDSEISGLLLNGQYFHDVLGTYMAYEVKLEMPLRNKGRYAALIQQLSEPVDGHQFVLPYNNTTLALTAKVEDPKDIWERTESGYTFWKGLEFTLTANAPTYEPTLSGAISRGLTPLPDVVEPMVGDTYTFTAEGWELTTTYPDADVIAY